MAIIDGIRVPDTGKMLPCGGVPRFDPRSDTYSYRCDQCFAVVGSVGMPRDCAEMWQVEKDLDEMQRKISGPQPLIYEI